MNKILVVEDDIFIGNLIEELLTSNGYTVIRGYSGTEALLQYQNNNLDLILLDLMLPGLSGEEVIKKINGKVPVIVLSAKLSKDDKVNNLLNGANDYITKPFNNDELLARIKVQLRNNNNTVCKDTITVGEISVDNSIHKAMVNNHELKLTKSEFSILYLLISKPNHVFSRSMIFEHIWDYDSIGDEETIKVHISNLRSKIKEHTDKKYIETVWGIGFKFNNES